MKLNKKVVRTKVGPITFPAWHAVRRTPTEWGGWYMLSGVLAAPGVLIADETAVKVLCGVLAPLLFVAGYRMFMRAPLHRRYSVDRARLGSEAAESVAGRAQSPAAADASAESAPEAEPPAEDGPLRPLQDRTTLPRDGHSVLPPLSRGEQVVWLIFVLVAFSGVFLGFIKFFIHRPGALPGFLISPLTLPLIVLAIYYVWGKRRGA
jgi:hypothetical protein